MLTRQLYSNATELINGCLEKSPGPVDHWAQVVPAQHRSQPGVDTSSFDLAVKDISSQESLCLSDNLRVSWHHCPVIIYFVQFCQLSNILTGDILYFISFIYLFYLLIFTAFEISRHLKGHQMATKLFGISTSTLGTEQALGTLHLDLFPRPCFLPNPHSHDYGNSLSPSSSDFSLGCWS